MPTTYDIFARKTHPDFLEYIGSVEVDNPDDVTSASLKKYGPESNWIEMLAVPQEKIITVFSEQAEDKQ